MLISALTDLYFCWEVVLFIAIVSNIPPLLSTIICCVRSGLEIERALPLIVRTKLFCLEENSLNWTVCESMPSPRCMAAYGSGCGHLYVMG